MRLQRGAEMKNICLKAAKYKLQANAEKQAEDWDRPE